MKQDRKAVLQERLDQSYQDYLDRLQKMSFEEIVKLAPEITAAQQIRKELLGLCNEDDVEFLLGFKDPLEVTRRHWATQITDSDHSEEMRHMLWEIWDQGLYSKEDLLPRSAPKAKNQQGKRKATHER